MKIIRYENTIINLAEVRNIDPRNFGQNTQIFFFFKNTNEYSCIKLKTKEVPEFINKCYEIMIREN